MKLRWPSAALLLPLLLASPMLVVGPYGVSAAEVLVVITGTLYLTMSRKARLPSFICVYLVLLTIGRITSLWNAPQWGVPVGMERLSFLYLIALPVLAYLVGRRSRLSIDQIVTGRTAVVIMAGVAVFAAAYPFLSLAARKAVLVWFVFPGSLDLPRYSAPRFPGLGINANIYAFQVMSFLLFAVSAHLKGKAPLTVAGLATIPIIAAASRLVMACTIAGVSVLWWANWRAERKRRGVMAIRQPRRSRRLFLQVAVATVTLIVASSYFKAELEDTWTKLVFVTRFQDLVETEAGGFSDVDHRLEVWGRGMERVRLAPLLGIAPNLWIDDGKDLVNFSTPHNEFIFFWTAYGLPGLMAVCYLVGYLAYMNLRHKLGVVWLVFYGALIVQMVFDGAFQYVRFLALFFVIVGLNVRARHLKRLAEAA